MKKLFDIYVTKVQKLSMELIKQADCATDSVLVTASKKKSKMFESHQLEIQFKELSFSSRDGTQWLLPCSTGRTHRVQLLYSVQKLF